ncbi:hypothetical protein ANO11243_041370 [Dothideomycetidae sp. 11243]|nr:hypothetical protein ANO11243_041370 [fungal sp. No.11243]
MSELPSDEVALDFKDSLSDLQFNNRYEISNLTIIAKENIEHAQALSRTLEHHIRTAPPNRKLPALYVLDSIVKNVGSPYTIYIGRNLFSIFMGAYTLVDTATRKAMESMLRTWQVGMAGSVDPTPVFPRETTDKLENALSRAKIAMQNSQTVPPRPGSANFQKTPTPIQQGPQYGHPQPSPQVPPSLLAALSQFKPQDNTADLKKKIEDLVSLTKADFAANPYDQAIQQKMSNLLSLQTFVASQSLPPDSLQAIRAQVDQMYAERKPAPVAAPQPWQPPAPAANNFQVPPNLAQLLQGQASTPAPTQPTFAPGALEALLKATANGQKPSTPSLPSFPIAPSFNTNGSAPITNGAQAQSLMDALKAAGLASASSTPNPPPAPQIPKPAAQSAADLLKSLSAIPGFANLATPSAMGSAFPPPPPNFKPRVPLSQSGLKIFNPAILAPLYPPQANQCPTCGLRFLPTKEGKDAKAAHLDWHFRTNQRIADSVHRSVHRNWYPDEHDWLALKEVDASLLSAADEAAASAATSSSTGGAAAAAKPRKRPYVLASTGGNKICPICQDAFVSEWSADVQDWVWNDAVEKGGRVYHAACFAEVAGQAPQAAAVGSGGGGVLGKRQRDEDPLAGLKAKLRAPPS